MYVHSLVTSTLTEQNFINNNIHVATQECIYLQLYLETLSILYLSTPLKLNASYNLKSVNI